VIQRCFALEARDPIPVGEEGSGRTVSATSVMEFQITWKCPNTSFDRSQSEGVIELARGFRRNR